MVRIPSFLFLFTPGLRLRGIDSLELIYGERDWMDVRHGNQVAEAEGASLPTVVQLLMDAGALGKARGIKNKDGINYTLPHRNLAKIPKMPIFKRSHLVQTHHFGYPC